MTAPTVTFARQVEELLAMVGETLDTDLLTATRKLRDVAAAHDVIDRQFHAAAAEVKRLIDGKIDGSRP